LDNEPASRQGDHPPRDRYEQSQQRFRTVFENSPLGQKVITPDLTIRQVNRAVLDMLDFTRPVELVGRKIIKLPIPTTGPTGRSCKHACGPTSCRISR
jgi:PAS domain-containing protein